mmetsp:Transcript_27315/g.61668  ORF Transcript_27315/g.61668 Transcript_27315/m.61668 type:complete len:228 (-) Transcript_27315:400-1083(-)
MRRKLLLLSARILIFLGTVHFSRTLLLTLRSFKQPQMRKSLVKYFSIPPGKKQLPLHPNSPQMLETNSREDEDRTCCQRITGCIKREWKDIVIVIGVFAVFEIFDLTIGLHHPELVWACRVFFAAISFLIITALISIRFKIKAHTRHQQTISGRSRETTAADIRLWRQLMGGMIIKIGVVLFLHLYFHLLQPLVVSMVITILQLPVRKTFANSLYFKYIHSTSPDDR